jgi:hypothetical protein
MTVYKKIDGVWTPASSISLKRNGVYVPVTGAYVKRSGVWEDAYIYDVEPPPPPVLTMTIVDRLTSSGTLHYRFLTIGVSVAGATHNTNVRRVRVLTTYNGAHATSQYGGTYHATPASNYPGEPWSEWRYNGFGSGDHHPDTSVQHYKRFPVNATTATKLVAGQVYHFRAWTEDMYGNWSTSTALSITGPKTTIDSANVAHKAARFQPLESGTRTSTAFTHGQLIQQGANPLSRGMWFYGQQIADAVGYSGTATIKQAQILLSRKDDGGSPTANVYIARHNYASASALPPPGTVMSIAESTKLGTIAKGETKWFALPESMHDNLAASTRGYVLLEKDPIKAAPFADDYTVLKGTDEYIRSGELYVSWSEAL